MNNKACPEKNCKGHNQKENCSTYKQVKGQVIGMKNSPEGIGNMKKNYTE